MGWSRRISHWDPEDDAAWQAGNNVIARRNLIWSIATMHVAFSIWYLWSVMVLFMPQSVYGFSTGDKLLVGDIAGFIALFIFCGVGKGSVFKLIPSVFAERSRALDLDDTECRHWERVRSAALIGFAGSFGALGGMVINLALRES